MLKRKTWLVLDVTFLAYRALHSTGTLAHKGKKTGVLYGILRDVKSLREHFGADHIVWCFDSSKEGGVREELCPTYNEVRKKKPRTDEEKANIKSLHRQINQLRLVLLPYINSNVVHFDKYEADDCIAWTINSIPRKDTAIMVTADEDMYQLIRNRSKKKRKCKVLFYNPNKHLLVDVRKFKELYNGLDPKNWVSVKALSGCKTDSVYGIPGIGESTAVKYLTGKLPKHYKSYKKIVRERFNTTVRNIPLVKLPFRFVPPNAKDIDWDKVKKNKYKNLLGLTYLPEPSMEDKPWKRIFRTLGITSL